MDLSDHSEHAALVHPWARYQFSNRGLLKNGHFGHLTKTNNDGNENFLTPENHFPWRPEHSRSCSRPAQEKVLNSTVQVW